MKSRIILLIFLSVFLIGSTAYSFAQVMSKQEYLDKSRLQRTTGFIMAGGGIAMLTAGVVIISNETLTRSFVRAPEESNIGLGSALAVVGSLSALGSIPVFISSGKNARRAAHLSLRNESVHLARYGGQRLRSVSSVRLEIPF